VILIITLRGLAIATHSQQHVRDLLQLRLILNRQAIKDPPIGGLGVIQLSRVVINDGQKCPRLYLPSARNAVALLAAFVLLC